MIGATMLIVEGLLSSPWNLSRSEQIALFEAAVSMIESLQTQLESVQSKWISVEERLPDERGRYLTVIRCSKGIWIELNNYDHLEELWEHDMDGYSEDATEYVTHWMPLPSCPKEVK